jgi:hypothetical protein
MKKLLETKPLLKNVSPAVADAHLQVLVSTQAKKEACLQGKEGTKECAKLQKKLDAALQNFNDILNRK